MTATEVPTVPVDATPYIAAVRSLLWSLPAAERDELVDDLTAHLTELAAEPGPPLAERLGPPSSYATEFVASVGVDASRSVLGRPAAWRQMVQLSPAVRARVRELRPAWLALRPFVIAAAVARLLDDRFLAGGNDILPLVVVAVAAIACIAVSQRIGATPGWLDRGVTIAGIVGAIVVANAVTSGERYIYVNEGGYYPSGVLTRGDGTQVSNIWAYDLDGNPIDVFLFDQHGRPLDDAGFDGYDDRTGEHLRSDVRRDVNGAPIPNLYPREQVREGYRDDGSFGERKDQAPMLVTPRVESEESSSTTTAPAGSSATTTAPPSESEPSPTTTSAHPPP